MGRGWRASTEIAPVSPPSLQERLEHARAGRWLLSVFLACTVGAVVVWNLPSSAIRDLAAPVVEPYVSIGGLDQAWNLFAPNPPQRTYEVVARIDYADGTAARWQSPRSDRWRKWMGVVRSDRSRRLWTTTAAWIAEHHDSGGRQAVRVELILRQRELLPPGSDEPEPPWREDDFYTYDVPGAFVS